MALIDRDATLRWLQMYMRAAKNQMKQMYDQHHCEEFDVGDMVFVRAQPYRRITLCPIQNQKLAFKCFGLF